MMKKDPATIVYGSEWGAMSEKCRVFYFWEICDIIKTIGKL